MADNYDEDISKIPEPLNKYLKTQLEFSRIKALSISQYTPTYQAIGIDLMGTHLNQKFFRIMFRNIIIYED